MPNYLIPQTNSIDHIFYNQHGGICKRQFTAGRFGTAQTIYKDGTDGFCAYADFNNNLNVICSNRNGDLLYFIEKDDTYRKYTLIKGNEKIYPKNIRVYVHNSRVNLLYTASYGEETLLIYCILGISSKPLQIDTLSPDHQNFAVYNNKVYYTNKNNVLGYMDFSDGKPDTFIPVSENACMPYLINHNGKDMLIYKSGDNIMCGDRKLFEDKYAVNPIMCVSDDKLLLLWNSVNFIKYSSSMNNGADWSSPMRFVASPNSASMYYVQSDNNFIAYYGTLSSNELHLIGANRFFSLKKAEYVPQPKNIQSEYPELLTNISALTRELGEIKKQLAELSDIFSDNNN